MLSEQQFLASATGKGYACGTFGELLQGVGLDDQAFLVTLPINRFSTATFKSISHQPGLMVFPGSKWKSQQLATCILRDHGLPLGGILELESNIPVGKGLASSSADLVATARAIDNCFGLHLPLKLLQSYLRQIEPTDGVMYEGIVAFYHRNAELRQYLGPTLEMTIVSIDEGGEVDTIEFNNRTRVFTPEEKQEYGELLQKIACAVGGRDLRTIGDVATRSAFLNQRHNEKRYFERLLNICREIEGLGVAVAHSGTYLGILLSPADQNYYKQLSLAYEALRQIASEVILFHSWHPIQGSDENHYLQF